MSRWSGAVVPANLRDWLRQLAQLAVLGLLVGIACWPFNLVDRCQDRLLQLLPAFSGESWTPRSLALACSPLLVLPLLLLLQRGPLARGAGSGIPQTMACIEDPEQADRLQGPTPTLQRLLLWTLASLSLLPLGREGPVVQVGAFVAHHLRRRFPGWLPQLTTANLMAVAAGAGLAGGFDTPLLGVVFVVEEFISSFSSQLIWPAMLVGAAAAAFSNLAGQPEFALGTLVVEPLELVQVLWAVPIGLAGGLLGALFGRMLLAFTRRCLRLTRRYPLPLGLALGLALTLFMLLSGGASGGDGEALMRRLLEQGSLAGPLSGSLLADLGLLLLRLIAPVLPLGSGVPGGLIDPAFAFGAVMGHLASGSLGAEQLGLALGMTAGLAGATQLPVMSVLFAVRMAADQQLLPGLLLAAVLAASVSRLLLAQPIYHALKDLSSEAAPKTAPR